jgi:hypothetical protein
MFVSVLASENFLSKSSLSTPVALRLKTKDHKNNSARFFLSFDAQYPNPEPKKGKKGCFAVADFWKNIGGMSKKNALLQLEKVLYQGLEHNGVQLPAAINFTHYTHGAGQVLSKTFVNSPWQLREFKPDIDAHGKVVIFESTLNVLSKLLRS